MRPRLRRPSAVAIAVVACMALLLAPAWADFLIDDELRVTGDARFGSNSDPVLEIDVLDGDTPAVRLLQDSSSGFNPQTWDVAGNETNFFVRDVSNGSTLPFRIRPGAPSSSIDIRAEGVGIGQTTPDARLHVGTGAGQPFVGNTDMFVNDDPVAVLAVRTGTEGPEFFMRTTPTTGFMGTSTEHPFEIRTGDQRRIYIDGDNGNIGIERANPQFPMHFVSGAFVSHTGQFVNASDANRKDDFLDVDTQEVLQALVDLPMYTWRHRSDPDPSVRHIGPTAQDFRKAFGFGEEEGTAISTVDADGVALASIQALYEMILDVQAENDELRAEVERLKAER